MAARADVRLSEAKTCEIVGISQQRRQQLVRRGLVGATRASGSTIHDAVELAAIAALSDALEPSATALAWRQLQPELQQVIGHRLDVVFDTELGTLRIARSDSDLRELVIHGRRVRVIALGSRLQEVRDAFRRWAEVAPFRPRRRRGTANRQNTA